MRSLSFGLFASLALFAACDSSSEEAAVQPPVVIGDQVVQPGAATAAPTTEVAAAAVPTAPAAGSGEAMGCGHDMAAMAGAEGTAVAGEGCGGDCAGEGSGAGCDGAQAAGAMPADGMCNHGAVAQNGSGGDEMGPAPVVDPSAIVPQPGAKVGDVTKCLVSGEVFTVTENKPHVNYNGHEIYFCCRRCVGKFQADPTKYIQ